MLLLIHPINHPELTETIIDGPAQVLKMKPGE